ncbi:UDP-N-acetylglucosamine 2-epimerase (non-hydrolyzing) [Colwellia sp. 4_MG-2023]|uniref:non-hydrolyzing UDP-N-acetylglucosamine 2-epimerase n=1 Tax=unclassified Colwellia TaxID=196834 RepID=UPI0026E3841B|nr:MULTISPECIES: UDP-N-acetylglucosamine 2-epimerase (non-hydrolyzing) [unclassified Colwellia]MDO6506824.1 UDP-N-acetylglucosamine 2-epimerase (non-hydrolyzing) [Colwellia sp. 5_MG-2023]MDO6555801.1 UDP-N-acetylglucosamine 2-epimerase (non-hydrolyzing) [Colwellia sp. 4_MG-2023]
MKIGIIVGTRPEIIKMAPVIRECQKRDISFFIIHSNQHYSKEMDSIFFDELKLPVPHYNLGVGSGLHSNQTGNILIKMEPILIDENPDVVLVQGDTNTVLAGALAASKLGIKVGHIEAGLRSYDRTMPEETNRIMTDHISEYLFAVGPNQKEILLKEGIADQSIYTVGNTVSDSLFQHLEISAQNSTILADLKLKKRDYFLVTAHRASNVDIASNLLELLHLFDEMHANYTGTIVWPIHPRTQAKIKEFNIELPEYLQLIPPVGYLDFIQLQKFAKLILTDSGGIQEEACLLGVPSLTLRENTERPEAVEVGASELVGRNAEKAVKAAKQWLSRESYAWDNPFGDGHVAEAILDIIVADNTELVERPIIAKNETLSVIGMGYMGLPISSLLAQAGYSVTGVDLSQEKVDSINRGECPFDEVGMPELVKKVVDQGYLTASLSIPSSQTYLVAVPTPHKNKSCDRSYVFAAVDAIAKVAKDGQTVIIESTISPRTSLEVEKRFQSKGLNVDVVHCPERAIPGQTLHELVHNDRIIGASSIEAQQKVKDIYQSFVEGEVFLTDLTTAECVKLVENTSRDVGIAFANELAQVCDELHVNVSEVIKLANRHPRVNVLNPGPGVGGHCIPIDPWFLVESTQTGEFIRLARKVNDERPFVIANKVIEMAQQVSGKNIAILGVAYKPNVDDCRETPAEPILQHLLSQGFNVKYHDDHVPQWECERIEAIDEVFNWADVVVIVTGHESYKKIQVKNNIIDACGVLT